MGRGRAVPRLCVLGDGIRLKTEEKSAEKTSVRVAGKCQIGMIQYVDMTMTEQQVFAFCIHTATQRLKKTSQEQANGHHRHHITVLCEAECTDTHHERL
jgi:hypothetical protein